MYDGHQIRVIQIKLDSVISTLKTLIYLQFLKFSKSKFISNLQKNCSSSEFFYHVLNTTDYSYYYVKKNGQLQQLLMYIRGVSPIFYQEIFIERVYDKGTSVINNFVALIPPIKSLCENFYKEILVIHPNSTGLVYIINP